MEQAEIESARRRVQGAARECFPDGAVQEVSLLQYGDDPRVEPGELVVRILVPASNAADAGASAGAGAASAAAGAGAASAAAGSGAASAAAGSGESAGSGEPAGFRPGHEPLDGFKQAHGGALERFRDVISRELPEVGFLELTVDAGPQRKGVMRLRLGHVPAGRPGDLTPVMARLGPTDLQTLDTLITTGIAANRADAVRWALARIRERPAYAELRERARQIGELKTQF
jgi:hypothetical protein